MRQISARHQGLRLLTLVASVTVLAPRVIANFDITRNDNLAVYWGQNTAGGQKNLDAYCQDATINNIIISFLNVFDSTGGESEINLANICNAGNGGSLFAGTQLLDCPFMASQIKACQRKGKIVTLALGGSIGQVSIASDDQARDFADKTWFSFLGGFDSNSPRPFGDAVLDGVDVDIEGGPATGYAAFVDRIREYAEGQAKRFYITASPQCPFPDANIGQALNNATFDAIYIQFYDNYCGLDKPNSYNFQTWDQWAKTRSPNKDIKISIGALAGPNGTGYVDAATLANYIKDAQETCSSFGGIALWEASLAVANDNYHEKVKLSLTSGGEAQYRVKSRFFQNGS